MQATDFAPSLEAAIAAARRRSRVMSSVAAVAFLAYTVVSFSRGEEPIGGVISVVALAIWWWMSMTDRTSAVRDLIAMRGARVDAWWPSPSHHLIADTGKAVWLGRLGKVSFDSQAGRWLNAVGYDPQRHALLLTVHMRVPASREDAPDRIEVKQHRVKLDARVVRSEAEVAARLLDDKTAEPLPP